MKLLYIVLFIALPSVVFAQSNYHEGSVLKNNGDTLKGFINYREWERSPKSIDFKINKDDKQVLHFDPQTIKEFRISGMETYISYIGVISMDKTSFPNLPAGLDTSKALDTIFLKQVVTGSHITLYYHNDERKTRFFIAEKNESPVELKYYQYYNDEQNVIESTIYKGQLILYINKFYSGNAKLLTNMERLHYAQADLEQLTDEINNNNSVTEKQKSSDRFFIGLAINRTITETNYTGLPQDHTTISPKISLGFDIFNNPNVQQFVFRAELSFSYVNPRFTYTQNIDGANNPSVYSFNQYTATITPQVLFNVYNKDNFKVYIDAGVAFNLSAYTNNKLTVPGENTIEKPYTLEPFWSNFPLQAGVILNKRLEICLTRIGYAAYTRYNGFYASNQSINLGIKFLLSKN